MAYAEITDLMDRVDRAMSRAPQANDGICRLTVIWGGVRYDVCTKHGPASARVYCWERDGQKVDPYALAKAVDYRPLGFTVEIEIPTPEKEAAWNAETKRRVAALPWFNNTAA